MFRKRPTNRTFNPLRRIAMPILHVIIIMTIIAAVLILVGLNWLYVAVGYALLLLIIIALYRR